ncbi:hypothetical protein LX59_01111 [Azomonas agilis]|uniref:Uncharacterized protein n=1 Tax=Azomonas agilis TaxID=116849 RepID=A0A562IYR8_9GAMM|nr:hypothetical protein [Azomonas agilis]TWH76191.1 hypothetical protein LX59_01111 [Azomonas agilis]
MLSYLRRLKERSNRVFLAVAAFFLPAIALAQEAGSGDQVTAGIASLQGQVLTYVGLGIGACVAILLVSLAGDIGIGVAKKWLRKGAS